MKTTVKITDTEEVEVTVTATMPIKHWRNVVRVLKGNDFNYHASTFGTEIIRCIDAANELVSYEKTMEE